MKRMLSVVLCCTILLCVSGCGLKNAAIDVTSNDENNDISSEDSVITSNDENNDISSEDSVEEEKITSYEIFFDELENVKKNNEINSLEWLEFCQNDEREERVAMISQKQSDDINIDGIYKDIFPRVNNTIALDDFTVNVGIARMQSALQQGDFNISNYYANFVNGNGRFPIVLLRQVDEHHYYTVYNLYDLGYLFVFYSEAYETVENLETDDENCLVPKYKEDKTDLYEEGCVYIEECHTFDEFKNISVGASIDDVIAIDSATSAYLFCYENTAATDSLLFMTDYYKTHMTSLHILQEGLLIINYEIAQDGIYYVTNIELRGDFTFVSDLYSDFVAQNHSVGYNIKKQFKILPQDYPPAN